MFDVLFDEFPLCGGIAGAEIADRKAGPRGLLLLFGTLIRRVHGHLSGSSEYVFFTNIFPALRIHAGNPSFSVWGTQGSPHTA